MDGDDLLKTVPLANAAVESIRKLAFAAFFDKLTGLPNHAALESLQEGYDRDVNLKWAVVFVDLSGFKEINDTYGHTAGNAALRLAGGMTGGVAKSCRGQAFRYGGDEFVAVVEDDSLVEFIEMAEQQLSQMTLTLNKTPIQVGATLGCARASENMTLESLIQRADAACRVAKSRADGRVVEWTIEIDIEAPTSERRKCSTCRATTTVLVLPSRKANECLKHCANCGADL